MKKGKITVCITMAVASFALMTIMFMQFKIVEQTDITSIETMKEEELRTELANWRQMYKEAQEQYNEKLEKLNEYKQKEASTDETAELVKEEQEQVNTYLGKTDVTGEGIIIKIKGESTKDEYDEYVDSISAEDLLIIVDYLKLAGAEAISINEKRIVNMSDIVNITDNIIYVNQERILSPYIIKAIGDSTNLESTLLGTGGYVELLKNEGFEVEIQKSNKVLINKYEKDISYKYMQE